MFFNVIHQNPGAIFLVFVFICYRLYQRSYFRHIYINCYSRYKALCSFFHRLFLSSKLKPESALYINERESTLLRTYGRGDNDSVLVRSSNLIDRLKQCLDNFVNMNFVSKTQAFGHHLVFSQSTFKTYKGYSGTEKQHTTLINISDEKKNIDFETHELAFKSCIKELIVLLEAKSNRKNISDIRTFCYRHSVNVLATSVFGYKVDNLTNSKCKFYNNCDQLYFLWGRYKQNYDAMGKLKDRKYFRGWVDHFINWRRTENKHETLLINTVVDYFTNIVNEFWQEETSDNCLAAIWTRQLKQANISHDTAVSLLISFSMIMLDLTSGIMAILLYEISSSPEYQERIRKDEKINFDLNGVPDLNFNTEHEFKNIQKFVNKCLATYLPEAQITLKCKCNSFIPGTNAWVKASSLLVIPVSNILVTNENGGYEPSVLEQYAYFALDPQLRDLFLDGFRIMDKCLYISLACLVQEYEFNMVNSTFTNWNETRTCVFSNLSNEIPVLISKLEKRGKIVKLEDSLKAFHQSRNKGLLSKMGLYL